MPGNHLPLRGASSSWRLGSAPFRRTKSRSQILSPCCSCCRFSRVRLCATPETAATRLPCPWDSPGKNTGVGCHFLLQWVKVKVKLLSRVRLLVTPWTAAYQAPPSMGFSRQEYWSGVQLIYKRIGAFQVAQW